MMAMATTVVSKTSLSPYVQTVM